MTDTLIIPKRSTQLKRKFFERDAESVARDLLGRTLVVRRESGNELYARLHEIAAYEGEADSMDEGALYAPGCLIVSNKYGKNILDIATNEICVPSCVTLVAGEVFDGRGSRGFFQGPGNLAKELEINKNYHGIPIEISPLWIGGKSVEQSRIRERKLSGLSGNCQGYFYFRE